MITIEYSDRFNGQQLTRVEFYAERVQSGRASGGKQGSTISGMPYARIDHEYRTVEIASEELAGDQLIAVRRAAWSLADRSRATLITHTSERLVCVLINDAAETESLVDAGEDAATFTFKLMVIQ